MVDVMIKNNKPIALYSRRLSKPLRNYTKIKKELIVIVECLKQYQGVILGYEINVFSDHNNLVYAETLSESQRMICGQLIIEGFSPNIQHISGGENIVADMLNRLRSTSVDKYIMVTDDTVHKGNNRSLFGTRGSLTFDFDIAPYTTIPFVKYFFIF